MKVQVLMSPGCRHGDSAVELVTEVVGQLSPGSTIERVTVATTEDATRWSCPGSPTIRVDGRDVEPDPPTGVGLG